MKSTLLVGLFLLLIVGAPMAQAEHPAPLTEAVVALQDSATWTFMVYIAADNDLEPFAINDLIEMQAIGSTDQVNIVVQIDRTAGYEEIHGDWTGTRRYYISQHDARSLSSGDFVISQEALLTRLRSLDPADFGITQEELDAEIATFEQLPQDEIEQFVLENMVTPAGGGVSTLGLQLEAVATLEETNTGDPRHLIDFATWAMSTYPADHYALVLWDHGGGWTSLASDESNEHDDLNLPEIDQALAAILAQTGVEKFDLISFDACLMAQLEVFQAVAPYADFALAAQETIPGAGHEYVSPLRALVANPGLSTTELGQITVDSYMTYYTEVVTHYNEFDLGLVDLSKVDAVTAALEQFSTAVQANPTGVLRAIGTARNSAQIFGVGNNPDDGPYFSTVDLIHFMELLSQLAEDDNVKTAAQNVITAAQDMIVYHRANPGLPNANGIAIYFPINARDFAIAGHNNRYPVEVPSTFGPWVNFLNIFHGTASATLAPEALNINISTVLPSTTASIYDPPVVVFETDGSQIVDLSFYAALQTEEGFEIIVDASPLEFTVFTPEGDAITQFPEGYSLNEFQWNVEAPLVSDGQASVLTVLLSNDDDTAAVSGIYRWANGDEANAYLIFDLETREVTSVWGEQESASGINLAEIQVQRGERFMPTYRLLVDGELVLVPSDVWLTFGTEPFTYEWVPAPSGDYVLSMRVEDLAGNVSVASTTVTIDNEGLDTAYRGFKDISFGINFLYPWGWTDPSVIEDEAGGTSLLITDPEGDVQILVEAYEVTSLDEITDIGAENLEFFGVNYSDPEFDVLNGYDVSFIYYDYETEEGISRIGQYLMVYVPENELGYIIDLDTPEASSEEAVEILSVMLRSLQFFSPSQ